LVKIKEGVLMKKILGVAVILIVGIACGMVFTYGPLHTQVYAGEGDVMAKLNEILRVQQEMKETLQVIKIRITQMQ
jgi:hypothetical protein